MRDFGYTAHTQTTPEFLFYVPFETTSGSLVPVQCDRNPQESFQKARLPKVME